jgi:hypothetical protein
MKMNRPFFAWPGWSFLWFAFCLSAANALWFLFVYVGSDWITSRRTLRVPVHLPIELSIPLVPAMVVGYMSLYLLFAAGPFIVRDRQEFRALIYSLALATFIGGIGFLLLPARSAFAPPGNLGLWKSLFEFADWMNLDYNMVPSLHVAFAVCCIAAFARHASGAGRLCLWFWALLIALATVLTHQHHIIDAVTGWIVGIVASRLTAPGIRSVSSVS